MIHLVVETFVLVLVTFAAGLACGFAGRRLHRALKRAEAETPAEEAADRSERQAQKPAAENAVQATTVRRIPDPAPPSEIRRQRLLDSSPKGSQQDGEKPRFWIVSD